MIINVHLTCHLFDGAATAAGRSGRAGGVPGDGLHAGGQVVIALLATRSDPLQTVLTRACLRGLYATLLGLYPDKFDRVTALSGSQRAGLRALT